MTKKIFFTLGFIFTLQLIFSCDPCECPTPQKYRVDYNDITVIAHNTAGFQVKPIEDTIHKNTLGLSVSVNFELVKLAKSMKTTGSFGFNSAMAFSCDCIGDEYLYENPIDKIEIYVKDVQTSDTTQVTDNFATYGYSSGNLISLDELFSNREEWHDGFQFELVKYESIPSSAIFIVEAYLASGTKLTRETDQINFY